MQDELDRRDIEVLIVIEGEIATTQLIERILIACKCYGVRYQKRLLSKLHLSDFAGNVLPIFIRCADPVLEYWVDLLRRARRPYLYYIDDNFWRIEGESELAAYYRHPLVRRALNFAVMEAQAVLTNSHHLAEFISSLNNKVTVLPAFFDFSLIENCSPEITNEIRIGFAGSSSRAADLEIIQPIIQPLLRSHANVVFEFAGAMPAGVQENERIRYFPHTSSYADFIRFKAERNWAIGLAPLVDSEANRCKTNNKYREYGACKIAGVYSGIDPYANSVRHGITGMLVQNTADAWLLAVTCLITQDETRRALADSAYREVLAQYSVESVSLVWTRCIRAENDSINWQNIRALDRVAARFSLRMLVLRADAIWIRLENAYKIGGISLVIRKGMQRFARR